MKINGPFCCVGGGKNSAYGRWGGMRRKKWEVGMGMRTAALAIIRHYQKSKRAKK
jgi:hypothetical protein